VFSSSAADIGAIAAPTPLMRSKESGGGLLTFLAPRLLLMKGTSMKLTSDKKKSSNVVAPHDGSSGSSSGYEAWVESVPGLPPKKGQTDG
jgi:hypothetical protein